MINVKNTSTILTPLSISKGGTNASVASITSFNNITGFSASGTTGMTSTNLVFSTSPTLVTPAIGAATGTSLALTGAIGNLGGTAGISLSGAGGILTLAGIGNTNNENLTFDFETTANAVIVNTTTRVNNIFFYPAISLGDISNVSSVVLLLHAIGSNTSTTILDSENTPKTVSVLGNAQITTAQYKFSIKPYSLVFDGTGDYLTIPDSNDWNLAAGDFTVDFWIRFNSTAASAAFVGQFQGAAQKSWVVTWEQGSTALTFYYTTDGATNSSKSFTWNPSTNTWYHVAVTRSGNNLYAFIDGTQIGTTADVTGVTFWDSTGVLDVGVFNSSNGTGGQYAVNGWMDEIRIVKGTAVWTANFTAPSLPYGLGRCDIGNVGVRLIDTGNGGLIIQGLGVTNKENLILDFETTANVIDISSTTGVTAIRINTGISMVHAKAALATTATDGFIYVPTSAGTPSGTPTAYTGTNAIEIDTTNEILYYYNSSWKTIPSATSTSTYTNKRITARVVVMADGTSFTPTGDTADLNTHVNTQAVGTLTANAPSGTPTNGQQLILRIKSTNAQTYSWNGIYRAGTTVALPVSSSGASKTDYIWFIYNSADSKWDITEYDVGF